MSAIDEHTGNLYRFYPRHTEWFGNASIIREAYVRDEKAEADCDLGAQLRDLPVGWAIYRKEGGPCCWSWVVVGRDQEQGYGDTPEEALRMALEKEGGDTIE